MGNELERRALPIPLSFAEMIYTSWWVWSSWFLQFHVELILCLLVVTHWNVTLRSWSLDVMHSLVITSRDFQNFYTSWNVKIVLSLLECLFNPIIPFDKAFGSLELLANGCYFGWNFDVNGEIMRYWTFCLFIYLL